VVLAFQNDKKKHDGIKLHFLSILLQKKSTGTVATYAELEFIGGSYMCKMKSTWHG